jgi:hypothetical protein
MTRQSQGRTENEARRRAEKIQYKISYKDSILDLGSGFAIDKESKYRGQRVEIRVEIPVGKRIRFDESVKYKLNPFRIKVRKRRGVNIEFDNDYHSFNWRSNIDYVMGEDGNLKNADGTPVINYDNDYRYNDKPDSVSLEEQRKRRDDEDRKLKEMENKLKKQEKKDSAKAEADEEVNETNTAFSLPSISPAIFFN